MPQVTIGMPIYERSDFLEAAITSLLAQSFRDFELIISDNASANPAIGTLCRRFAEQDRRVIYHRHATNLGAVANFLSVAAVATSPLFMWASDDDVWDAEFLARGVAELEAHPESDAWFCRIDNVDRMGRTYREYPPFSRLAQTKNKRDLLRRFLLEPEILGKANLIYCLYRREALRAGLSLFPHGFGGWGGDMHLVYAILCRGDFVFNDKVLFHKRVDTLRPAQERRWARRHVYPLNKASEYFAGYVQAAKGTQYATMTRWLLVARFLLDRAYWLATLIPFLMTQLWRIRPWRSQVARRDR